MKPTTRALLMANLNRDNDRRDGDRNERMNYTIYAPGPYRVDYPRPDRIGYDMDEPEMRRRRDSRGRFRSEAEPEMRYPHPYPPPIYEDAANPIGFAAESTEFPGKLHMIRGGADHHEMKLDEDMADEWMKGLKNEDGTKGPHWTKEQTTQLMKQKNIDCDPLEFWVAMNAMYSDYFSVAKKSNVNNVDFYVNMAKAFLDDKDAIDGKLAAYYEYVVK